MFAASFFLLFFMFKMFQFNVGREKRSVQVHKDILAVLLKILKYGVPSIGSAKRNHLNTFGTVGPAIE